MSRYISYGPFLCRWCGNTFLARGSRQKHCSVRCRFTERAWECRSPIGCWEWDGSVNPATGYGQFMKIASPMELVTAHRISWELYRGEIPNGLLVLHKCDNKKCFNPDHLFLGTHLDNMIDKIKKGRDNAEARSAGLKASWAKRKMGKLNDKSASVSRGE